MSSQPPQSALGCHRGHNILCQQSLRVRTREQLSLVADHSEDAAGLRAPLAAARHHAGLSRELLERPGDKALAVPSTQAPGEPRGKPRT